MASCAEDNVIQIWQMNMAFVGVDQWEQYNNEEFKTREVQNKNPLDMDIDLEVKNEEN